MVTGQLLQPPSTRAKPPKRRPPSQHFRKENIPDIIDIQIDDNSDDNEEAPEDVIDVVQTSSKISPDKPLLKMLDTSQVKLRARSLPKTTSPQEESDKGKPSWLDELHRKQGNRKSIGTFLERQEISSSDDSK